MDYKNKYLKYKSKYKALLRSIRLDDYIFTIIGKNIDDERNEIFINSYHVLDPDTIFKFSFYKSISELNFLRLRTRVSLTSPFYKGLIDYVQQSFVDFRLQKFINENYDKIPIVKDRLGYPEVIKQIIDCIDDKSRFLNLDPFTKKIFYYRFGYNLDEYNKINKICELMCCSDETVRLEINKCIQLLRENISFQEI